LTWLALLSEQTRFQLAWSLGPLKDSSLPGLQTSGVFHLDDAVFPGVSAAAIAREVLATMPETDGPTTAFLIRVVAQLALAEVALTLEEERSFGLPVSDDFTVTIAQRADALESKALTPRMPGHAEARVLAALEKMEPALAVTVTALLASKELVLLEAVRALPATHH
jgi:hypothetical protein